MLLIRKCSFRIFLLVIFHQSINNFEKLTKIGFVSKIASFHLRIPVSHILYLSSLCLLLESKSPFSRANAPLDHVKSHRLLTEESTEHSQKLTASCFTVNYSYFQSIRPFFSLNNQVHLIYMLKLWAEGKGRKASPHV